MLLIVLIRGIPLYSYDSCVYECEYGPANNKHVLLRTLSKTGIYLNGHRCTRGLPSMVSWWDFLNSPKNMSLIFLFGLFLAHGPTYCAAAVDSWYSSSICCLLLSTASSIYSRLLHVACLLISAVYCCMQSTAGQRIRRTTVCVAVYCWCVCTYCWILLVLLSLVSMMPRATAVLYMLLFTICACMSVYCWISYTRTAVYCCLLLSTVVFPGEPVDPQHHSRESGRPSSSAKGRVSAGD